MGRLELYLFFPAEFPGLKMENKTSLDTIFEELVEELINMTIITVDKAAPNGKNQYVMKSNC